MIIHLLSESTADPRTMQGLGSQPHAAGKKFKYNFTIGLPYTQLYIHGFSKPWIWWYCSRYLLGKKKICMLNLHSSKSCCSRVVTGLNNIMHIICLSALFYSQAGLKLSILFIYLNFCFILPCVSSHFFAFIFLWSLLSLSQICIRCHYDLITYMCTCKSQQI